MDYRDNVFISVAENLSISKAAEEMHISQPAVSKHIKELENKLNVALFTRRGNKIYLTNEGTLALTHLKSIRKQYASMEFELGNITGNQKGELTIGASSTISQYVIPSVLASFHKRYPEIKITLLNGNSYEIEELLLVGKIDLAMVENDSSRANIRYIPVMNDNIIAITGVSSAYAGLKEISLNDLTQIPLLIRERGSGTLEVIEKSLKVKGISIDNLNIFMHLGATETIKNFLDNFDGIALVSEWAIKREALNKRFKTIKIKNLSFERHFRAATLLGPTFRMPWLFIEYFKEYNI
ncbi:MAG: LysR family transcriptional regulator [Lentimicrobiaceae bacterium]